MSKGELYRFLFPSTVSHACHFRMSLFSKPKKSMTNGKGIKTVCMNTDGNVFPIIQMCTMWNWSALTLKTCFVTYRTMAIPLVCTLYTCFFSHGYNASLYWELASTVVYVSVCVCVCVYTCIEGDRQSVFRSTKIRTALKGDSSWIQRGNPPEQEEEDEKPWCVCEVWLKD